MGPQCPALRLGAGFLLSNSFLRSGTSQLYGRPLSPQDIRSHPTKSTRQFSSIKTMDPSLHGLEGFKSTIVDAATAQIFNDKQKTSFSPYAYKLIVQFFVWLASIVVMGNAADFARMKSRCDAKCGYIMICGFFSFVAFSLIFLFTFLNEKKGTVRSTGAFSYFAEIFYNLALFLWWIPGVGVCSTAKVPITRVGVVFSWIAFTGSGICVFKAYQTYKWSERTASQHLNENTTFQDEIYEEDDLLQN